MKEMIIVVGIVKLSQSYEEKKSKEINNKVIFLVNAFSRFNPWIFNQVRISSPENDFLFVVCKVA